MKTAVVLSIAVLANSLGNVCLSLGMQSFDSAGVSEASWLPQAAAHVVTNPWMIAGVLLLVVFLSAYLTALSWADLSFVLPATAPAYIFTAILARVFLNEAISPARWAGTLLIMLGTCFVARTFSSRAEAPGNPESSGWPKDLANAAPAGSEARSPGKLGR